MDFQTLSEEEENFLSTSISGTSIDPFSTEIRIEEINISFKEEFKKDLELNDENLEELLTSLSLRHCELCGAVESLYDGGGTTNGNVCCENCYYQEEGEDNDEEGEYSEEEEYEEEQEEG